MPRLTAVPPERAQGESRQLLERVEGLLGMVPNFIRTLAGAPAALQGYLAFAGSMERSRLPATLRAQISLSVAELHECEYGVASHSSVGLMNGLSEEHLLDGRRGSSPDRRAHAALTFAHELVQARGRVSDEALERLRRAGFGDGEIVEIIATACLTTFTSYLNHVAETEIDFPSVPALARR